MSPKPSLTTSMVKSIEAVEAAAWDALGHHDNPFLAHAFLRQLETSGSVGERTPWRPRFVLVHEALPTGARLVAAAPAYLRTDSYGEYIFDFQWAEASARAGLDYYPKLTVAVPYTPATGPRLLTHPDFDRDAALDALVRGLNDVVAREELSGIHVLFPRDDEVDALTSRGFLRRASMQFHWRNDHYQSYDAFLAELRHDARKELKRERRRASEAGVEVSVATGDTLDADTWREIYALYTSTSARKWGRPYLTQRFFERAASTIGASAVLALGRRDGALIAMSLSFERGPNIYGRYWGASDDVPGLHFELCYHQLIERAIARGATIVEAGAQGEHKLKRGFLPVVTHSAHLFVDPRLHDGVGGFLRAEARAVEGEVAAYLERSPFKEERAPPYAPRAGITLVALPRAAPSAEPA